VDSVLPIVKKSQLLLRQKLEQLEQSGGLTIERYVRYLSMQFHLTKDVQRHFFTAASHPSLATKGKLREFLVAFALEEEMHYRIAARDIENLNQTLLPIPLDVKLWWAYFDSIIYSRPFVRLGATCILENLGSANSDIIKRLLKNALFLNERNSRFIRIHMHEDLPHGDWIMQVLKDIGLDSATLVDLKEGAETGAILYLRMMDWVGGTDELAIALGESSTDRAYSTSALLELA
jgi:hypothetical protein